MRDICILVFVPIYRLSHKALNNIFPGIHSGIDFLAHTARVCKWFWEAMLMIESKMKTEEVAWCTIDVINIKYLNDFYRFLEVLF